LVTGDELMSLDKKDIRIENADKNSESKVLDLKTYKLKLSQKSEHQDKLADLLRASKKAAAKISW